MAFIDNLCNITISRGECLQIPLFVNMGVDEEPVRLNFNEISDLNVEVYLGIHLPHQPFECSLIRKIFTYLDSNEYGDIMVKLNPQDTLNMLPGKYFYSIKLRMQSPNQGDWVSTIIDEKIFQLT